MPHASPAVRPTRRTVVRAAAWTVPAVAVVTAAPAFAGTGESGVSATWGLTADPDLQFSRAGDLTWTVTDADLAAGSTVTLVVSDPQGRLEGYVWLEAVSADLDGAALGAYAVPAGGSTTLVLTTTAVVPVGSTFGVTLGPENNQTGSYAVAWTVDPANPVGADLTGCASWSAAGGFAQTCAP